MSSIAFSQIVIDEAAAGDPAQAKKRLEILDSLFVLEVSKDVEELAEFIVASGAIPRKAARDAGHIAVATVHEVDYLLMWNCKHLANAHILRRLRFLS